MAYLGSNEAAFRLGNQAVSVYLGAVEVYTPGATLYFNAAVDNAWTELGNWWLDDEHTVAATALPTAADSVVVTGALYTGPATTATLANLTVNNNDEFYGNYVVSGAAVFESSVLGDNSAITGNVTFNGISANGGTVTGNATFNDSAIANGTVSGNATFNGTSINYGTVTGNATFNGSSYNGGTLTGNATFNDTSGNNSGTVTGDATFNDSSYNYATVTGTATFTGSACNVTGSGTAGTFVPDPPPEC